MLTRNDEFIHRHPVGTCSKCGEVFYGGSVLFFKLVSYDQKGKMRCSCGNVDEWMNYRDYGVKKK